MVSDKEKVLNVVEHCIAIEESAIENYSELIELTKDKYLNQFLDDEKRHISLLNEISSLIQQI